MSPNKQKQKGDRFEREMVEVLESSLRGRFKRSPSSGAVGTIMGESLITGDLNGSIEGLPKKVKAECKVGYSSKTDDAAKSFRLEKEWIDKIIAEAELAHSYPILFGKFSGVKIGVKRFAVLDMDTFLELINYTTDLKLELDKLYNKYGGR